MYAKNKISFSNHVGDLKKRNFHFGYWSLHKLK